MQYTVSSFDVCFPGFERLRSQDEFILLASINNETTAEELLQQWLDDVQSCERSEKFDYQTVRSAVSEYFESYIRNLFTKPNPFNLEPSEEDVEGCTAYLYVEETDDDEE